jgi:HEPN domain-containing protein
VGAGGGRRKMARSVSSKIAFQDFCFENSLVKMIASRSSPEIRLGGLCIGPFEEGNEYETYFWAAQELEKNGIARFHEKEKVDVIRLNKIQWTERIQIPGQISRLPDDFYPKTRRLLKELKNEIGRDPEKIRDYEKVKHLSQDILNSRLRKIISIACTPGQTESTVRNLAEEEKSLYDRVLKLVSEWKLQILKHEEKTI